MARLNTAQLSIRSDYARDRAADLARATGMSTTKVVEEALRAWSPPPVDRAKDEPLPPGLVRKGRFLVLAGTGRTITFEETNAWIEDGRNWGGLIQGGDEE